MHGIRGQEGQQGYEPPVGFPGGWSSREDLARHIDDTQWFELKPDLEPKLKKSFEKDFGFRDLPFLSDVYEVLQKTKEVGDLPESYRESLIEVIGRRKFERMTETSEVLNELRNIRGELRSRALDNDSNLLAVLEDSKLSRELFISNFRGSREYVLSEKKLAELIELMQLSHRAELPAEYEELSIDVLKKRGVSESGRKVEKALNRPDFMDAVEDFLDVFSLGNGWKSSVGTVLDEMKVSVLEKKIRLKSRIDKMPNPPEQMAQTLDRLEESEILINDLDLSGEMDEQYMIAIMEELARLQLKGPQKKKLLRIISARHMSENGMAVGTKDTISRLGGEVQGGVLTDPSDQLQSMVSIVHEYIDEHYLNSNQEGHGVDHAPFSSKLIDQLKFAWGLSNKGDHIFKTVLDVVRKEEGFGYGSEEVAVQMVPSHGLLQVLSGDNANSCYVSKREKLAKDDYPDMHAYTFVSNRNTSKEEMVGSVLFVETQVRQRYVFSDTPPTALLIRANNPRLKLLNKVDVADFVKQTFRAAIEIAKRRGLNHVVVPALDDPHSGAGRPEMDKYYRDVLSGNPPVDLEQHLETEFNGYTNWDSKTRDGVVEIWSKDKGAIGDWDA